MVMDKRSLTLAMVFFSCLFQCCFPHVFRGENRVDTQNGGVPVYTMLPLDTVNNDGELNDPQKLQGWFSTLKSSGVKGVMADVWFGLCEPSPKQYNFEPYQQLVQLVADAGLELQAVMSFHQCGGNVGDTCDIPLPSWVTEVDGAFYKDQEGNENKEYISLFSDEKALFGGRTPIDIYTDFMAAFKDALGSNIGSVITEVQVGCGPAGELRYPSYPLSRWSFPGVGEFQCYDDNALADLADYASEVGHPEWGHGGPNNAGNYNNNPDDTGFFGNGNDNYSSDYGRFFLGWYSQRLIEHGDRVLTAAKSVFGDSLAIASKVSGIHWWYKHPSHAAELTAGYYNTDGHDAYDDIAKMYSKNGIIFDFTCLEMRDSEQPSSADSGPEETKVAARNARIGYAGENALPRYDTTAYQQIEAQSTSQGLLAHGFTYLRLNDDLLSGGNLQNFQQFVQNMNSLSNVRTSRK